MTHKLKCFQRIRALIFKHFHLGVYLNCFLEGIIFILLNTLNEIRQADISTVYSIVSFATSCIVLILALIIVVLLCIRVMYKDKNNEDCCYCHSLYNEINIKDPICRAYYVSFLVRRVATCVGLIVITNPKAQWMTYFFIQCCSLVYSLLQRSFITIADNINLILCDFTLVVVTACVLSMPEDGMTDYSLNANENRGMVCCCIIVFCNIVILLTTLIQGCVKICGNRIKLKLKNIQKAEKRQEITASEISKTYDHNQNKSKFDRNTFHVYDNTDSIINEGTNIQIN